MISTKTLKDRWAVQKNRFDMASRSAQSTRFPEEYAQVALAKARLDLLESLENQSREQADIFRNWLISETQKYRVPEGSLPPGDKRVHEAKGARTALAHALVQWDQMQDEGENQ